MKKLGLVVNKEIAKVANWMSLNKLFINYNKTEFMVISNSTKQLKLKLKINIHEIKQKQETKYLGVLIDNTLTWKAHIKLVCTKLARGCFALIKLQNLVNLSTLKSVYYSMVYTHLQYWIAVWGFACKIAINPLKKMLKKIVRIMVKASFTDPSLPIFHELNILKVADIYKLEITKLSHRVKKHVDKYQFSCFKSVSSLHNYNTWHSADKN